MKSISMKLKEKNSGKMVREIIQKNALLSVGLLATIIGTIITGILPPLVLENIVNKLSRAGKIAFSLVLLYVILLAVSGIFEALKESLITVFGQKVTHGMRSMMCEKMNRLPAAYFNEHETGVITSRIVNDVDTVENLFTSGIISMVVDACKVMSILFIIFVKSKGLGFLMLLVTPLLLAMTLYFQKRMLTAQRANRQAVGRANNHVPETINNIRMIHTFHSEAYMQKQYDTYIGESYEAMEKSNFYDAIYSPIIITLSAVIIAVMIICAATGGGMQQFFGMSVGTAVAVMSYVSKVFSPLESIGMEIQNIQSAIAGLYRINEFMANEERKLPTKGKVSYKKEEPAISFDNVCFGYTKQQEILHDCTFSVASGENVTLTGRTGIGKSTVFKLILGLYSPWRGQVRIYGVPIEQINDIEKAKRIGYVEQTFQMIPGTVKEQITLKNPSISQKQVENALEVVGMNEVVQSLKEGYDTLCTNELFSQGQFQLLSIARAIVLNPSILLLDEITANLDSATEESVLSAIQKASENRTVLSISHRVYPQSENEKSGKYKRINLFSKLIQG